MCNMGSRLGVSGLGVLVALGTMPGGGCSVEVWPNPAQPSGTSPSSNDDRETMILRFVNEAADLGVDLEFYATNEPLDVLPDDLFVTENLVTEGLGFLGSGTLGPLWTDTVDFPCTQNLTIGTLGGTFRDTESNEERGVGVKRWATDRQMGLCGAVATFTFAPDDDGFTTTLTVGD